MAADIPEKELLGCPHNDLYTLIIKYGITWEELMERRTLNAIAVARLWKKKVDLIGHLQQRVREAKIRRLEPLLSERGRTLGEQVNMNAERRDLGIAETWYEKPKYIWKHLSTGTTGDCKETPIWKNGWKTTLASTSKGLTAGFSMGNLFRELDSTVRTI